MDKIKKALQKFSKEDFDHIQFLLQKIEKKLWRGLDLKKLKGTENIFRVRKGKLRIIFRLENGKNSILKIERRNDNTYHEF